MRVLSYFSIYLRLLFVFLSFIEIFDKAIINGAETHPATTKITGKTLPQANSARTPIIMPNTKESYEYLIISEKRNFSDCFGVTIKVAFLPSTPKKTVFNIMGASEA